MKLQFNVACGSMSMIAQMGRQGYLSQIGITPDDFELVSGNVVWKGSDRNRVQQIINNLMFSTMDICGTPRFQIPAEYIAATIAMFVKPINMHVACRFFERASTADAMGRSLDDTETCTAQQLFALLVQLVADPTYSKARHLFERNTGLKIIEAESLTKEEIKEGLKNKKDRR